MKFFESSADIKAPSDKIWEIITDGPGVSKWDSGIDRIDGPIAPGERIKLYVNANPGRAFPLKVITFEPGERLVLMGGMPLGLFRGVRTYTLNGNGDGTTHFRMREEYSGPMLRMIWPSIPDLDPSFRQYAAGLKVKAEAEA